MVDISNCGVPTILALKYYVPLAHIICYCGFTNIDNLNIADQCCGNYSLQIINYNCHYLATVRINYHYSNITSN